MYVLVQRAEFFLACVVVCSLLSGCGEGQVSATSDNGGFTGSDDLNEGAGAPGSRPRAGTSESVDMGGDDTMGTAGTGFGGASGAAGTSGGGDSSGIAGTSGGGGSVGSGGGGSSGTAGTPGSGGSVGSGGGGTVGGTGLSADYPGDVGIGAHPTVLFHEDFESATMSAILAGWDYADRSDLMSISSDVPAEANQGTQSLRMAIPANPGETGVGLFENLPNQQVPVYVRYYAKYNDRGPYHHAGMWTGGYNPPYTFPIGTAGAKPDGTDFFHNVVEPFDGTLGLDQYAHWPDMECQGACWGNNMMWGERPRVVSDQWVCLEVMMKVNTPGQNDGEFAVWINDQAIQHLREGEPNMDRTGWGVWGPDPNGDPFPGFNWRSTTDLAWNWIWLDFYENYSGALEMKWDQVVVAKERIGCMTPAN